MRIEFKRAGGFAAPAMRLDYTVDLDKLSADEAAEVQRLVQQMDIAELAARPVSNPPRPDAFHYRVVIDGPAGRHTIQASDADMPGLLRPLVEWLTQHAGSR